GLRPRRARHRARPSRWRCRHARAHRERTAHRRCVARRQRRDARRLRIARRRRADHACREGALRSSTRPQRGADTVGLSNEVRLKADTTKDFASLAPLEPLIDKCVHCGFCLPTCPSYILLGQEMDSPRGRIYMMKAGVEGRPGMTVMSDGIVGHFDTYLGCMACETACPSGVRYAPLIEETRAAIEHHHTRSLGDRLFRRLLFSLLPYPA